MQSVAAFNEVADMGHAIQVDALPYGAYVFSRHGRHCVPATLENQPGAHARQIFELSGSVSVPGGHFV